MCGCSVLGGLSDKKNNEKDIKQPVKTENTKPENAFDVNKVINGEWIIETVGETRIVRDEDVPYIFFDLAESSFYASNGCNILNGVFSLDGDRLTFLNIMTTMKYCADTPFDAEINAVIADGRTVVVRCDRVAAEGVMTFEDQHGRQLMTLRRHAMAFLNGHWRVVEINGEKVDNDDMTVFIDLGELRIHGNTGCNYFNGSIRIEPGLTNGISFSNMGVTRRMCQNADLERRMLVALEECTTAVSTGDNTAVLTGTGGKSSLKLVRIENTDE